MKLGINTFIWSPEYDDVVEHELPLIKKGGFDGIEIPIFRPMDIDVARIRRAVEDNALECNTAAVLVDGLSLISPDASLRARTLTRVQDIIKATAEVGGKTLAGPLYSPVGFHTGVRRTIDEWSWAVEAYQALGETLETHDVTLAIEPLNRFETYFLNTAGDAKKLADEVGHVRVGILYDTFHANVEEKDIAAGLRVVGSHVKLIHTCENDRGIPGSGHIEWGDVFQAIHDIGYDGWLTIESFGFALGDLSAAAAIWRDIEVTPSVIAYDGAIFLRECLHSGPLIALPIDRT